MGDDVGPLLQVWDGAEGAVGPLSVGPQLVLAFSWLPLHVTGSSHRNLEEERDASYFREGERLRQRTCLPVGRRPGHMQAVKCPGDITVSATPALRCLCQAVWTVPGQLTASF